MRLIHGILSGTLFVVSCCFFTSYHYAHAQEIATIEHNVSYGQTNREVRAVQQALNTLGFTVAQIGPGSRGNETLFFGPQTLRAVREFQRTYASDVLEPLGLVLPTGFVGQRTRAMLNRLIVDLRNDRTDIPSASTPTPQTSISQVQRGDNGVDVYATEDRITQLQEEIDDIIRTQHKDLSFEDFPRSEDIGTYFITSLSHSSRNIGAHLEIRTSGARKNERYTVHFGDAYHIPHVPYMNGVLRITIPDIPYRTYDVAFSDVQGRVSDTRSLRVKSE